MAYCKLYGRSRMVLNHRLLNLSFNTTLDVTKQLELSKKHTNSRSRMVLNHRLLNLPFNTALDVTKQLKLSKKHTNAFKIILTRKLD